MAVMVLVVLASLGALFLVGLLIALDRDQARAKQACAESFIVLEQKARRGPRLVRSATSNKSYRVPQATPAGTVLRPPAAPEQQPRTQAR